MIDYAMPMALYRDLSQDDKAKFLKMYINSASVRERIIKVLTNHLESAILDAEKEELYSDPSVTHKIAYSAGYRYGLREALSYLTPYLKEKIDQ